MLLDVRHLADSYQCSCYVQMKWLSKRMTVLPKSETEARSETTLETLHKARGV